MQAGRQAGLGSTQAPGPRALNLSRACTLEYTHGLAVGPGMTRVLRKGHACFRGHAPPLPPPRWMACGTRMLCSAQRVARVARERRRPQGPHLDVPVDEQRRPAVHVRHALRGTWQACGQVTAREAGATEGCTASLCMRHACMRRMDGWMEAPELACMRMHHTRQSPPQLRRSLDAASAQRPPRDLSGPPTPNECMLTGWLAAHSPLPLLLRMAPRSRVRVCVRACAVCHAASEV